MRSGSGSMSGSGFARFLEQNNSGSLRALGAGSRSRRRSPRACESQEVITMSRGECMYARIALFEDHDPEQMDELVRRLEERSQNPEQLPHAKAFLALVDRESGKSVGITFFESEEAMEAS